MYEDLEGLDELVENFKEFLPSTGKVKAIFSNYDNINDLFSPFNGTPNREDLNRSYFEFSELIGDAIDKYIDKYKAISAVEMYVAINDILKSAGAREMSEKEFNNSIIYRKENKEGNLLNYLDEKGIVFDELTMFNLPNSGQVFKVKNITSKKIFFKDRKNAQEYVDTYFLISKPEKQEKMVDMGYIIRGLKGFTPEYKQSIEESDGIKIHLDADKNGLVKKTRADKFVKNLMDGSSFYKEKIDKIL